MEIKKMKCPVCGKEEFVLIDRPYSCGMETYIEDSTDYYICLNCGLILRFAKGLADNILYRAFLETDDGKKYIAEKRKLEGLNARIDSLEKKKRSLEKELDDDRRSIKRDKEIKEELKEISKELASAKKDVEVTRKEIEKLKK